MYYVIYIYIYNMYVCIYNTCLSRASSPFDGDGDDDIKWEVWRAQASAHKDIIYIYVYIYIYIYIYIYDLGGVASTGDCTQ
jgi:hypothetical protein